MILSSLTQQRGITILLLLNLLLLLVLILNPRERLEIASKDNQSRHCPICKTAPTFLSNLQRLPLSTDTLNSNKDATSNAISFVDDVAHLKTGKCSCISHAKECKPKILVDWIHDLKKFQKKYYSQNGEDGVIEEIFHRIGEGGKFYVEFGVQSGKECNTRYLRERKGWTGLMMDNQHENISIGLRQETITVQNIADLFAKYSVPHNLDLLSLDTNFGDFWFLRKLLQSNYRPRVIVIEFNGNFNFYESLTVPLWRLEEHQGFDGKKFFQSSPLALTKLAHAHGYVFVATIGLVNVFYIHKSEFDGIDPVLAYWNFHIVDITGRTRCQDFHKKDTENRLFTHICLSDRCKSEDDW